MTPEQLKRGKEIEEEINKLIKYIEPLTCKKELMKSSDPEDKIFTEIPPRVDIKYSYLSENRNYWSNNNFFNPEDAPSSELKTVLQDGITDVLKELVRQTQIKIAELNLELLKL